MRVLIERPLTSSMSAGNFQEDVLTCLEKNYLGAWIKNISKAMDPGRLIEIEWLPCSCMLTIDQDLMEGMIKKNPFQSFFNIHVLMQSIFALHNKTDNFNNFPPNFKRHILKMKENVHSLLLFYDQLNVGHSYQVFLSTLYWEASVAQKMLEQPGLCILLDYNPLNQNGEKLKHAFGQASYVKCQGSMIGRKVEIGKGPQKKSGKIYDIPTFLTNTFFNFMLQDLAAELNKDYVREYLVSEGFTNISIERTNNPHNGRKNVHMIRMQNP